MSIPETRLKIKSLGITFLKIACICLILGLVFTLGRISALSQKEPTEPIKATYPPLVKTSIPHYSQSGTASEPELWAAAGSKTGKTYYPKGCSGLTRVKPENRVYFSTTQEAEMEGYKKSTGCN